MVCFTKIVVMARIIPDEEQAISSAAGIKLLVDLLRDSANEVILALAADCVARLAHTRAGAHKEVPVICILNVTRTLCISSQIYNKEVHHYLQVC